MFVLTVSIRHPSYTASDEDILPRFEPFQHGDRCPPRSLAGKKEAEQIANRSLSVLQELDPVYVLDKDHVWGCRYDEENGHQYDISRF